ncbi:MAG: hypothetical protein JO296_16540 [Pseudonocardiales bacterium]|nr:hypothetical protein [Pseudonocardiales bacterium]
MSAYLVPAGPAEPAQRSAPVTGTVTVQDGRLAVDLAPTQDSTRTAVVRPIRSPYAALPAVSHWYLDQEGGTALLAFVLVTAFFLALGCWL